MKKILNLIAGGLSVLAVSSCGQALMDYAVDAETPIVESYLQEGTNHLTVKVYSMEAYLKNEYKVSKPVAGLDVNVNDRTLTETSPGTYFVDWGNDTVRQNQTYELRFAYNGQTIQASATVPPPVEGLHVEPESLELTASGYFWDSADTTEVVVSWDDPDHGYYQVYIESPQTTDVPSLGLFGRRMMQPFRGNTYKTTAREFRSAGTHWIYVYRVNTDYADLYERISSSDLANPVSSIQNAFGIFTASSMARTQLWAYE
ncbi:MAG: DUF4249 domain-containing protein [Tannerellaceae bacterium]|jgi:hypothetical protein|nr:DUF4249 domain-containing protein [Tannerellaceae bacterium]